MQQAGGKLKNRSQRISQLKKNETSREQITTLKQSLAQFKTRNNKHED